MSSDYEYSDEEMDDVFDDEDVIMQDDGELLPHRPEWR